jgi:hypothetical protein
VAMAWVDQACGGFFAKEQAGTLKATDVYLFRVAAMLDDFAVREAVLRRYSRTADKLSADQADVVSRFQAWLRVGGCAVSTVRSYGTVAAEFVAFTGRRGGRWTGRPGCRGPRCVRGHPGRRGPVARPSCRGSRWGCRTRGDRRLSCCKPCTR